MMPMCCVMGMVGMMKVFLLKKLLLMLYGIKLVLLSPSGMLTNDNKKGYHDEPKVTMNSWKDYRE
uniref:Uncharacterized protein n=1 Tax=Lepeophtheirus salmonis TaxID=72036 RepID=A0A0K2T487_LEPSM